MDKFVAKNPSAEENLDGSATTSLVGGKKCDSLQTLPLCIKGEHCLSLVNLDYSPEKKKNSLQNPQPCHRNRGSLEIKPRLRLKP